MSKRFTAIVAICALLSPFTMLAETLLLKNDDLVITLGNSITQSGENPAGYVSLMRKLLTTLYPERTIYIVNSGISGHKAPDMKERFERDVLQYSPDWVTISVGINDVWHGFYDGHDDGKGPRGVPLQTYQQDVTDMVQRAQSIGCRVALLTTTVIKEDLSSPENRKLTDYNKALRQIAKKKDCLLIDLNEVFHEALIPFQKEGMADRGILTYDGVHMRPEGDWLMAKTILTGFGVPIERIDAIRWRIEQLVDEEKQRLTEHAERYREINYEVGAPRPDEKRVVFYGSSSVDGWDLARDFPNIPFLNRGIGGENTREMVFRFRQDVVGLNPRGVLIFFGSCNDFWPPNQMNPAETKSNMIKMARYADRAGIKVAFGAVSPVNDYIPGKDLLKSHPLDEVKALNDWIAGFCAQNGYEFIDFYSAVADEHGKLAEELTEDGMHCNTAGYNRWKPLVIRVLKNWDVWKD